MATLGKVWNSTGSVAANTAANWSDTTALSTGDAPIFNGSSVINMTTDMTDADTYPDFTVDEDYTGDIGATGAPLTPTQFTRLNYRGSGRMYAAGIIPTFICDSGSTKDDALVLSGTAIVSGSVLRGKCTLASGASVAATGIIEVAGNGMLTINAGVTVTAGAQFRVRGSGVLVAHVDPLAVYVDDSGTFNLGSKASGGTHALTLCEYGDGNVFIYSTGTVAKVRARKGGRGTLELGNEYARVITSIEAWAGPRIDLRKGKHCTVVITAKDTNEPLNILWPLNTTITPS